MRPKKAPPIKGYVYHQNHGKVSWDRAAWEQFISNYTSVKVESVESDDGKDYLISARGTKNGDWKQRNLIAECYEAHPTRS